MAETLCGKCRRNGSPQWWKCCPMHAPEGSGIVFCDDCRKELHPEARPQERQDVFALCVYDGEMQLKVVGRAEVKDDFVKRLFADGHVFEMQYETRPDLDGKAIFVMAPQPSLELAAVQAEDDALDQAILEDRRKILLKYIDADDTGLNIPMHGVFCEWQNPDEGCTCGVQELLDHWKPADGR